MFRSVFLGVLLWNICANIIFLVWILSIYSYFWFGLFNNLFIFAGLELIKYSSYLKKPELYYWQRAERNAQAEVDYVITKDGKIYPIEVKASKSGSMQSMYKFIELKNCDFGYRLSLEPFSSYPKVTVIPLYALSNLNFVK
jgi:predicted AAA+ superfamily ATPase